MADDDGKGGTPSPGSATDSAADDNKGNQGAQQSNGSGGTPDAEGGTQDSAAGDTEALRKALKAERESRRDLEKRLKAIEEKDLPDADKARTRVTELEEENKSLAEQLVRERTSNAVTRAAASLGIVDVEVASLLLEQEDTIDYDDDGKPTNVEAALKALIAKRPFLVKANQQNADAAAGTRTSGGPVKSMNDLIRRAAGREG